jgi:hypothetical protein
MCLDGTVLVCDVSRMSSLLEQPLPSFILLTTKHDYGLFIRLIICFFQLVFFSRNNIFLSQQISQQCFQLTYQRNRTAPILVSILFFLKDHMRALPAISHYK